MRKLLLATRNIGKIREIKSILSDLHFQMTTIDEVSGLGPRQEIAETGTTFAKNAAIKAETLAKQTNLLTIADDSGLEVDALGGKPGVKSARFVAGPDAARYTHVLALLKGVPWQNRQARFKTAIAIHDPESGTTTIVEGKTEGRITVEPRGTYGFGYDPIFYSAELGKTFGEAGLDEKNRISHRGKALRKAKAFLLRLASQDQQSRTAREKKTTKK